MARGTLCCSVFLEAGGSSSSSSIPWEGSASGARTVHSPATAFFTDHPAPIDCLRPGEGERNLREILELRAEGERSQGRTVESEAGSPAEEALERLSVKPRCSAEKRTQAPTLRGKLRSAAQQVCHGEACEKLVGPPPGIDQRTFKGLTSEVVEETPLRKARLWKPASRVARRPKGHHTDRSPPGLHTPRLPHSVDLAYAGPFPIEKRMAELAAHAYYLLGGAKHVAQLATRTSGDEAAWNVERFARQADAAGRAMARAAHIPLSTSPPNLPLTVGGCLAPELAFALKALCPGAL
eukprot:CAMPEP_0176027490 /NCGR_PEP_ID=MMETSP0120_2-20121206/13481_1 /TAXON_ID=160619 /ORGANISM="Kryptoperidinium foliaceum, Strain CCMP 1326" /LENGTH=294 /DNA_ID=CAMNT_0017360695 /DNA_START=77 /DNA_END=958 /DNA_ORIENTATION=-